MSSAASSWFPFQTPPKGQTCFGFKANPTGGQPETEQIRWLLGFSFETLQQGPNVPLKNLAKVFVSQTLETYRFR